MATITISDGNTVPSISLSGAKVYPNIGSGTICKVSWSTVHNTEAYVIVIYSYNDLQTLVDARMINVGICTEFYITSEMCPLTTTRMNISVSSLQTVGSPKHLGETDILISKAAGMYVKNTVYTQQPIMKRAIALARVSDMSEGSGLLISSDGFELIAADTRPLAEDVLIWSIMKDFYIKNNQGTWESSNITYEVLIDQNGEPITTSTGDFIYLE